MPKYEAEKPKEQGKNAGIFVDFKFFATQRFFICDKYFGKLLLGEQYTGMPLKWAIPEYKKSEAVKDRLCNKSFTFQGVSLRFR